jgi:hypothetical protein
MSVYAKLNEARVELQNMNIKKGGSGFNFKYYDLADFLPVINLINAKYKLHTFMRFNHELASLVIIDAEDTKETIEITCPMAEAQLPKGQPIQNLGASITYIRRYLYMVAYEIVEHEMIDSLQEQPKQKKAPEKKPVADKPNLDALDKRFQKCKTAQELIETSEAACEHYKSIEDLMENEMYVHLVDTHMERIQTKKEK